jgi:hypothetical protein
LTGEAAPESALGQKTPTHKNARAGIYYSAVFFQIKSPARFLRRGSSLVPNYQLARFRPESIAEMRWTLYRHKVDYRPIFRRGFARFHL